MFYNFIISFYVFQFSPTCIKSHICMHDSPSKKRKTK